MSEWRYVATRLNGNGTETVLDRDLPLSGAVLTDELSGAGGITGVISPETARLRVDGKPLLVPWSTAIYAEADGIIRAGAILVDLTEEGPSLKLECIGFSGYLQDQVYSGEWIKKRIDPALAVAEMWRYIQAQPGGNIGLKVPAFKTDKLIGNEVNESTSTNTSSYSNSNTNTSTSTNGKTGAVTSTPRTTTGSGTNTTTNTSVREKPYELAWWKTFNLGNEFVKLAQETPFDFRVSHRWDGEKILHEMAIDYPMLIARKTNLRFVVGENIYDLPTIEYDGDQYVSHVVVVGAGEGRKAVRGESRIAPTRLYRSRGAVDSGIESKTLATSEATRELKAATGGVDITEVLMVDHPHAPLGSVSPGDEIYIQTTDGWTGSLELWVRVLAVTIEPATGAAKLTVSRTEKVQGS